MILWRCARLRPRLVEFAEGTLAEAARARLERHLSSCTRCAEEVFDLRELPAEVRRAASAEPPEEFWTRQRRAILEAIEERPVATPRLTAARARPARWGAPAALAASAALALFASRSWAPPRTAAPAAERAPTTGAATRVANVVSPRREPASRSEMVTREESMAWADDALFPEDTSLLGLADELDDDPAEASENALI